MWQGYNSTATLFSAAVWRQLVPLDSKRAVSLLLWWGWCFHWCLFIDLFYFLLRWFECSVQLPEIQRTLTKIFEAKQLDEAQRNDLSNFCLGWLSNFWRDKPYMTKEGGEGETDRHKERTRKRINITKPQTNFHGEHCQRVLSVRGMKGWVLLQAMGLLCCFSV